MPRPTKPDLEHPFVKKALSDIQTVATAALEAERTIEDATVPIYWTVKCNKPEQIGTAIVLSIGNQTFLLTAAHVLEPIGNYGVLVGLGDGSPLVPLMGDRFSTAKGPSGSHSDDPIDAAVLHIQGEPPARLKQVSLSPANLDLLPNMYEGNIFLIAGFRAKQTRTKGNESHTKRDCIPTVEYAPETYQHLAIDRTRKIALAWEDQILVGGTWQDSPRPKGMSGGAIIRVTGLMAPPRKPNSEVLRPLLSATVSEHHREKGDKPGVLVGPRIGVHLGLIDKYLPELELEEKLREHLTLG